ncbi:MAG: RICIN domain-containing protein [Candidatus Methylacidiphilales bacterium]|nr:RICIN domain-containing protein [Candidatus Methylacidiphilales bacterium]
MFCGLRRVLAVWSILTAQLAAIAFAAPLPGQRADDFVESCGINIKLDRGVYFNWTTVKSRLDELNLRHYRDGLRLVENPTYKARYQELWDQQGMKLLGIWGPWENFGRPPGDAVPTIKLAAPFLHAVEGPNEPDLFWDDNYNYGGQTERYAEIRAYQNDLFNAVHGDGQTSGFNVTTPAMAFVESAPRLGSNLHDLVAWHFYTGPADMLGMGDRRNSTRLAYGNSSKPSYLTETGSNVDLGSPLGISERAQMKMVVRAMLLGYLGDAKTYLHQLMDEGSEVNENNRWGIVRNDGTPRPAFNALKNLVNLFNESTFNTSSKTWSRPGFNPPGLDYSIQGGLDKFFHILFQKADGTSYIVTWIETSSYNKGSNTNLETSRPMTLNIRGTARIEALSFDNNGNWSTSVLTGSGSSAGFTTSDSVTVIKISNLTGDGDNGITNNMVYELEPLSSTGQRLDVAGAADANGANVHLWTTNGAPAQAWRFTDAGAGFYELTPQCATGRRLDVAGSGTVDGTNVHIWQSNGAPAQKWRPIRISTDVYEFEPMNAPGKRLDVAGNGADAGLNVQIRQTNAGNAQRWRLSTPNSGGSIVNNALYELEPQCAAGKRLDVNASADVNGANVQIWQSFGNPAQTWRVTSVGNGFYELTPQCATGRRLDVDGMGSANGTNVHIWQSFGNAAQRWKLISVGGDLFELEPECAPGKRLDVAGMGSANGTNVHIWQSFGNAAQRWKLIRR